MPYGSWPSRIDAEVVAADAVRLSEARFHGDDLFWLERRPAEGGRTVVVRRRRDGETVDVVPPGLDVRTRVHEYGGGAWTVAAGQLFVVCAEDQAIRRIDLSDQAAEPVVVVEVEGLRFADLRLDPLRDRLIAVCEDHSGDGEADNRLVSISLQDGTVSTLAQGSDFYSNPEIDASGSRLAWLCWDHPDMPWDGARLEVAAFDGAGLGEPVRVAGGAGESIFQPRWSEDGDLVFVGDRGGWWNLLRWDGARTAELTHLEAELGLPQWVFGMSTWDFCAGGMVFAFSRRGVWGLGEWRDGEVFECSLPFSSISDLSCSGDSVAMVAASPTRPPAVAVWDRLADLTTIVRGGRSAIAEASWLSVPRTLELATTDGEKTHAFYYPPCNPDYRGPEREFPPLLVLSHGGPTAATSSGLDLAIQFWTSRGFAVADVNYRGSTGYGRDYRRSLDGRWGVADVDDCVAVAEYLAAEGLADPERLAIRGGSAGGYTTLAALAFREVFSAGASYYGIGDLESLALDTHKFESRYLDRLVGPYPERRDLYLLRSPIHSADSLSCPVIFFQGLDDKVVPPNQAEAMVAALDQRGVAVAYVAYEGEAHGFRRAENLVRSLECELYFYSRVFGFDSAGSPSELEIRNRQSLG